MPNDRSVAMCRTLLRLQLRRLRTAKGLAASHVAREFGWSPARMTRLETADTAVEVGDVRLLCTLYEAPDELREELEGYALITKTRQDWWDTKRYKGSLPSWFEAYLGLEAAARRLELYQSEFVPGLIQNAEYAKAILRMSDASDETIERQAEARLKRQVILQPGNDAAKVAKVSIILNESVIRRPIGGADVFRTQLERLADLSELPHIEIRVLPFSAGAHPAMHGAFTNLNFADETVGDLTYLENLADGGVLSTAEMVELYLATFRRLEELALAADASHALLRAAAADL